jgi:hypothetical protein
MPIIRKTGIIGIMVLYTTYVYVYGICCVTTQKSAVFIYIAAEA